MVSSVSSQLCVCVCCCGDVLRGKVSRAHLGSAREAPANCGGWVQCFGYS